MSHFATSELISSRLQYSLIPNIILIRYVLRYIVISQVEYQELPTPWADSV